MNQNFFPYLDEPKIQQMVKDLATQINRDYEGQKLVLVPVLKGTIIFAADLIRHITVDVEIDFVRLYNYGKSRESNGTITVLKDIGLDVKNKHVLIVEEIIDSGRKLKFLYERLKTAQPKSVEVVTLLDKEKKRMVDVPVKYVGMKTEDQFLVGYGLDLEEKCRNLRDIFYLKYPN